MELEQRVEIDQREQIDQKDLSVLELLTMGSAQYSVELGVDQVDNFNKYATLLKEWNEKIN